jgi:hypothetical protein
MTLTPEEYKAAQRVGSDKRRGRLAHKWEDTWLQVCRQCGLERRGHAVPLGRGCVRTTQDSVRGMTDEASTQIRALEERPGRRVDPPLCGDPLLQLQRRLQPQGIVLDQARPTAQAHVQEVAYRTLGAGEERAWD